MVVKVTADDSRWDTGLNGCLVEVEHQYLLCQTHYLTELQTGSGM